MIRVLTWAHLFRARSVFDPAPSPLPSDLPVWPGPAVSNMIARKLKGVEFLVCNTDAQHLSTTLTDNRLQLGRNVTEGLGCGANPDAGRQVRERATVRKVNEPTGRRWTPSSLEQGWDEL